MPMTPEATDELKAMVPVARKRAVGFGLCLGKKPEGTVMMLHRMKDPSILARLAKKEGETPKVTFGTVSIKGKKMMLTCEGDILPGMSKHLRKFLSGIDLKMKVVALDPSGALADDDGEPEEADEADGNDGAAAEAQGPEAANWAKIAPAMATMIGRLVEGGHDKAAQIEAAWARAEQAADADNYQEALTIAAKLKPLLAAAPKPQAASEGNAAGSPDAARWSALAPALEKLFEQAMSHNPENRSQLGAAWAMATEKAGAGDFAAALQVAARLKQALEAAVAKGGNGAEREVPKDVVPFQKSRVLWGATKSTMMKEMAKLEAAIVSVCADDPELAPVAAEATELRKRLDVFDARLEDVLDRITNTPEGDARTALKVEARAALKDYSAALQDDFFADVDTENGFAQVAVAASARKALDAIAKVLG